MRGADRVCFVSYNLYRRLFVAWLPQAKENIPRKPWQVAILTLAAIGPVLNGRIRTHTHTHRSIIDGFEVVLFLSCFLSYVKSCNVSQIVAGYCCETPRACFKTYSMFDVPSYGLIFVTSPVHYPLVSVKLSFTAGARRCWKLAFDSVAVYDPCVPLPRFPVPTQRH